MLTEYVYLRDMAGGGAGLAHVIRHANGTHTISDASPTNVVRAEFSSPPLIGLRRYLVEYDSATGMFRETGEALPIQEGDAERYTYAYEPLNGWNNDPFHYETERAATPEMEARVRQSLEAQMVKHPYEFKVLALQRRWLAYTSDGSINTQANFIGLLNLHSFYSWSVTHSEDRNDPYLVKYWSSKDRDNQVPCAVPWVNRSVPLLYYGPAWVVRFSVDGQVPAFGNCRVYVSDDGTFLCSDWCQRHDAVSYSEGINLQLGMYTFDSWVIGPCLLRAKESGEFVDSLKSTRVSLRSLPASVTAPPKTFGELLSDVQQSGSYSMPDPLETFLLKRIESTPEISMLDKLPGLLLELRHNYVAGLLSRCPGLKVQVGSVTLEMYDGVGCASPCYAGRSKDGMFYHGGHGVDEEGKEYAAEPWRDYLHKVLKMCRKLSHTPLQTEGDFSYERTELPGICYATWLPQQVQTVHNGITTTITPIDVSHVECSFPGGTMVVTNETYQQVEDNSLREILARYFEQILPAAYYGAKVADTNSFTIVNGKTWTYTKVATGVLIRQVLGATFAPQAGTVVTRASTGVMYEAGPDGRRKTLKNPEVRAVAKKVVEV